MQNLIKAVVLVALVGVLSASGSKPKSKSSGFCASAVSFRAYAKQEIDYCNEKLAFQKELLQEQAAVCEQTIGNLSKAVTEQTLNCNSALVNLKESSSLMADYCRRELAKYNSPKRPELVSIKESDVINSPTSIYYISKPNEQKTWYMANAFCKINGMELASVETKEENDFLTLKFGTICIFVPRA
ncbi:Hypothetical predicted protein [Cloeon dipterum]|uniref:C-type lectin domain-containing protein n=1 Tax=Cloeon dipterum TaxID=197152 RepID=A0A8S1DAN7_9INSE|nr:Hypothetical predicted protein [Cloeon dipterum]